MSNPHAAPLPERIEFPNGCFWQVYDEETGGCIRTPNGAPIVQCLRVHAERFAAAFTASVAGDEEVAREVLQLHWPKKPGWRVTHEMVRDAAAILAKHRHQLREPTKEMAASGSVPAKTDIPLSAADQAVVDAWDKQIPLPQAAPAFSGPVPDGAFQQWMKKEHDAALSEAQARVDVLSRALRGWDVYYFAEPTAQITYLKQQTEQALALAAKKALAAVQGGQGNVDVGNGTV